jgi:hypothetical protein
MWPVVEAFLSLSPRRVSVIAAGYSAQNKARDDQAVTVDGSNCETSQDQGWTTFPHSSIIGRLRSSRSVRA